VKPAPTNPIQDQEIYFVGRVPDSDIKVNAFFNRRANPAGARFEEHSFANEAGRRTYKLHVPSRYAGVPLPALGDAARLHPVAG
jgi:hypothetical protein